jgi:hypothetical protein
MDVVENVRFGDCYLPIVSGFSGVYIFLFFLGVMIVVFRP